MKIWLLVAVEATAIIVGTDGTDDFDPKEVAEAAEEAVFNALRQAESDGFDHEMKNAIVLSVDYVEVKDTDLTTEF